MKKSIALTGLVILSILLLSCSPGSVKSGLTPETVAEAYEESSYSTWCHTISGDDADAYKYKSELKVYDPDNESEDCVFVYFFDSAEEAEAYKKEQESKSGGVWLFSLIFGRPTAVRYDRYDYMVVESFKSAGAVSRKNMIGIFEDAVLE